MRERARLRGRRGRGRREASLGEAGRSASGRPSVVHNRIRESTRPLRSPLPRTRAQVPAVNLCPAHACGARLGLRRKWATLRRREAAARSPLEGKTRSWVAARRSAKDRFAAFPHRQSADFERLVAHKVRAAMPPAAWTVTRAILGFGWMDGWMDGWAVKKTSQPALYERGVVVPERGSGSSRLVTPHERTRQIARMSASTAHALVVLTGATKEPLARLAYQPSRRRSGSLPQLPWRPDQSRVGRQAPWPQE